MNLLDSIPLDSLDDICVTDTWRLALAGCETLGDVAEQIEQHGESWLWQRINFGCARRILDKLTWIRE